MTIDTQLVNSILEENEKRWKTLKADYNPVTGEGLPGDRVKLEIPDFAIPVQYVPRRMLRNKFVHEIIKAGSIAQFLKDHPDDPKINSPHKVEVELRKIRHRYDFPFWAYFCFPIIGKEGGQIRFKLNLAQLELEQAVEEKIEAEEPIDIILVKARQFGGSTYFIAKQTWILTKLDNYHSFVIAAHLNSASENIQRMMKYAIRRYPAWDLGLDETDSLSMMPVGKTGAAYAIKNSRGEQVLPGLIYIGSSQSPDSIRSAAVFGAHYSETAFWKDTQEYSPEKLIASISGSILKRPLSMQCMESTAKSSDDFFHDVYMAAKKGQSSYKAIFIPWYHIPHDTIPIKDKKKFIKELIDHKDDETPYGRWQDSGKHYWWLWTLGATLEGINWYKYKRLDYTTYAQMANEAPTNDVEAFQAAGSHVFDIYKVEALRKYCKKPFKTGNLISNNRRDKGVLKGIKFIEQNNGNLNIWEFPDDTPVSNRYIVSVDIGGSGPNSDYHSVRVMDRLMMMPEFNGRPNVVAEMHYHCPRADLVYDAIRLAEWYNHALLVIESNTLEMNDPSRNTEGDGSQFILDQAAELYTNLYARESPADQIIEGAPKRWGFQTNAKTKPMIIDFAQWCISERAWEEPSELCLDEFSMYVVENNKFTAPKGRHDDIIMSQMINLWVCFHEMPLPKFIDRNNRNSGIKEKTLANI